MMALEYEGKRDTISMAEDRLRYPVRGNLYQLDGFPVTKKMRRTMLRFCNPVKDSRIQ